MRGMAQAAVAAALGLLLIGSKVEAQNVNVVINGQPVTFTGTPPQELNGSVLVPLRGVFEQLGASVQYNPSTKTIFAQRGSTNVSLALGSSTAYVNNQPEQLAQAPTVLLGTTLVPLRFVAEAFGAYVEWQAQTSTVQIQTNQTAAAPPPPVPAYPGNDQNEQVSTISGRIINIDNPGNPQVVTVGTQSGPVQINIRQRTRVVADQATGEPAQSSPTSLVQGDTITARIESDGDARFIDINSQPPAPSNISGRIVNVDNAGNPGVLTIGTPSGPVQVNLNDHTRIVADQPNGTPIPSAPEALQVGQRVTVKLWPNGNAQFIDINFAHHDHDNAAPVSGRIVNIDDVGGPGLITIGTPTGPVQIGVDQNTVVTEVDRDGDQGRPASTEALRDGDDVTAQLRPNGSAQAIQIKFEERRGHVITVQNLPNGNSAVLLDNGQIVQLDRHVTVLHDHHPSPRPIQPGDSISVRLRSGGQTGYSVDLNF